MVTRTNKRKALLKVKVFALQVWNIMKKLFGCVLAKQLKKLKEDLGSPTGIQSQM